jgi:hypothetical protein
MASVRFFQCLPHRFVRNAVDNVEFYELVGQQAQCPAATPVRCWAAREGDQVCLLYAVEPTWMQLA